MKESELLKRIHVELAMHGTRLFRNNVGVAHHKDGARVVYGLHPGSSDLIGWTSRRITPDMVGSVVAVFSSIEVKTPKGTVAKNQKVWLGAVRAAGGIAIVARSVSDAVEGVKA